MVTYFHSKKRENQAQALVETSTALAGLIGMVVIGVLFLVNIGLSTYYIGKTDLIARQAALYAATLPSGDPNIKQETAKQITPLFKAMSLPVPNNFGQPKDQSITVDNTSIPNVVSVKITLNNLLPFSTSFVPSLLSASSQSAAFIGQSTQPGSSNTAGSIALSTQSTTTNSAALLQNTLAVEGDNATTAQDLNLLEQGSISMSQYNKAQTTLSGAQATEANLLGINASAVAQDQKTLGNDQGAFSKDSTALDNDSMNLAQLNQQLPKLPFFKPSQRLLNQIAAAKAAIAKDQAAITKDQAAVSKDQTKINSDIGTQYSIQYSYIPIAGVSNGTTPPSGSSVSGQPVYQLGSVAEYVPGQDWDNGAPPNHLTGPISSIYLSTVTGTIPHKSGSSIASPIYPSPGEVNAWNTQSYYLGDPFVVPGLPAYNGLQLVTPSLPAINPPPFIPVLTQ